MESKIYPQPLRLFILTAFLLWFSTWKGFAQNPNGSCDLAQELNIDADNQNNIAFTEVNWAGLYTISNGLYTGALDRDAWYWFSVPADGTYTIQLSPTSGHDLVLFAYDTPCGAPTGVNPRFSDNLGGDLTETIEIIATAGSTIRIRIAAKDAVPNVTGVISIYRGEETPHDLCSNAQEVRVGACGLNFDIERRFFHHEGRTSAGTFDPTSNNNLDGWIKFTPDVTGIVGIEYAYSNQDGALELYTTAKDCGTLTPVNSLINNQSFVDLNIDDANGGQLEIAEITVNAGQEYYVRIMNLLNNETMNGGLCIYDARARDECANTQSINVPSCNIRVNVPDEPAVVSPPLPAGVDVNADDQWLSYTADSTGLIRLEYTAFTANSEPSVFIYDLGTGLPNCGAITSADIIAFDQSALNKDNLALTFPVTIGHQYYIRLFKEGNPVSNVMVGNLCIYKDDASASPRFFLANEFDLDGNNCGEQFNVLATDEYSTGNNQVTFPACDASNVPIFDGWAFFRINSPSEDLIIEYNNNNSDFRQANDVSLQLFQSPALVAQADIIGGGATLGTGPTIPDRSEANWSGIPANSTRYVTLDVSANIGFGELLIVVFEGDQPHRINILNPGFGAINEVERGTDTLVRNQSYVVMQANIPFFDALNNLEIEIENTTGNPLNGRVKVFRSDDIQNIGGGALTGTSSCSNDIDELSEGDEVLRLNLADQSANHFYFIRVGNITTNLTNSIGSLCVRPEIEQPGDLCNNAIPMLVGDCDIPLEINSGYSRIQPDLYPTPCIPANIDSASVLQDLWVKFTATTNGTTVQFEPQGSRDIAIATYRGVCGPSGILEQCANEFGTGGRETLKLNTVPGVTYFVQIISLTAATANGRICITNTTGADPCVDENLLTLEAGDCNVLLDVPNNFENLGADFLDFTNTPGGQSLVAPYINEACDLSPTIDGGTIPTDTSTVENTRDAFVRLIGKGGPITITYQNVGIDNANTNPVLMVYTSINTNEPISCSSGLNGATNNINQLACSNDAEPITGGGVGAAGPQTEILKLPNTVAGQQYIIRVLDLADGNIASGGMQGILCISDGTQDYNTCADTRQLNIGDCGVPVQVLSGQNDCSGNGAYNTAIDALPLTCSSPSQDLLIARSSVDGNNGWYWQDATVLQDVNNGPAPTGWLPVGSLNPGLSPGDFPLAAPWEGPATTSFGFDAQAGRVVTPIDRLDINGIPSTTYYFARLFNVVDPSVYSSLLINLRKDDGAVVYINGREVVRDNLPLGVINHNTTANSSVVGGDELVFTEFRVSPGVLLAGDNVITVELHNAAQTNSDVSFDIEVVGVIDAAATCDPATEADVWFSFNVPPLCDGIPEDTNAVGGCDTPNKVVDPATGRCVCSEDTYVGDALPDDQITVQYDNRNFILEDAADVSMIIYLDNGNGCVTANVNTDLIPIACVDDLGPGAKGIEQYTISNTDVQNALGTDISPGQNFKVRVINNDPVVRTALGNACVLWGTTLAQQACPPSNDYGDLDGDFKDFEVLGSWTSTANFPTSTIPDEDEYPGALDSLDYNIPCVVPGGSDPASNSPDPIRTQGWMKFDVPIDFISQNGGINAVTVQYNNAGLVSGNPQNAALAIYSAPNSLNGQGINCQPFYSHVPFSPGMEDQANDMGLQIVGCVNSVFEGVEGITIVIDTGRTYFVRVMNVSAGSGNPPNMPGQIRILPFVPCDPGLNLVDDGDFENWPVIQDVFDGGNPFDDPNLYTRVNNDIHTIPEANANRVNFVETFLHFATDYGFARDSTDVDEPNSGRYDRYTLKKNELEPEGLFSVRQTPFTLKRDWYGYGQGYSGYGGSLSGGAPRTSYCAGGGIGDGTEACDPVLSIDGIPTVGEFGIPQADRPALIPQTADANFMIVNGIFPNQNIATAIGVPKVWCQTIDRGEVRATETSYYIFSVWIQNMISGERDLDIPFLRLTICDMQDPVSGLLFPDTLAQFRDDDGSFVQTQLPGVTSVFNGTAPGSRIAHNDPTPGGTPTYQGYDFELPNTTGAQNAYGAALPCNVPGVEPENRRLKILGSSFFVNEKPDNWVLVRCLYRAPSSLRFLNACVENLSLNEIGNDFGIDGISFRECKNSAVSADLFERLLKGDPCELANTPQSVDLALNLQFLDFTANLIGEDVHLNWLVAQEENVSRYEIQRGFDGTTFGTIGVVDRRPSSDGFNDYTFVDQEVPEGVQYIYYRVRIINSAGDAQTVPPIRVDIHKVGRFDLTLVKNPTFQGNDLEVRFFATRGQAQLKVTSMMGVPMRQEKLDVQEGENSHFFNTGNLYPGIYLVTIEQGAHKETKRMVVY